MNRSIAFTLAELLIVIVIIAVLAAIAIPMNNYMKIQLRYTTPWLIQKDCTTETQRHGEDLAPIFQLLAG